jgi:hypothetical protein
MATIYNRSLSGDFGGNIVVDRLQQSIINDGIITKTLTGISVYEDDVDITFAIALTTPEETQLDVLIAAHDGVSAEPDIEIITTGALNSVMTLTVAPTVSQTITFPDATTEMVGTDISQTISNKILQTPQIETALLDINGNNMLIFDPTTAAVNAISITNAALGNQPTLTAVGDDANINIELVPKGTGIINIIGDITTTGNLTVGGTTTGDVAIDASDIISGTFDDARIAQSNVTQHQTSITAVGVLDGGSITSNFGNIDNGSNSITSGTISVDDISFNGSITTMTGANGTNQLIVPDNLADAFTITDGTQDYLTIVSTTAGDQINLLQDVSITGDISVSGNVNGRNIATDGTNQDNHIAASSGVHGITGDVVGTTDSQLLTNKTITDVSNNVAAKSLHSSTTVVDVSGSAAPSIGQSLIALSDTEATWQSINKSWKTPCRFATTQPLSAEGAGFSYSAFSGAKTRGQITWSSGPTSLDGVVLQNDDRILVKDNTNADENGVWVRTNVNVWDRADDFDDDHEVVSLSTMWIEEGIVNAEVIYYLTTDNPITIGGGSGSDLLFTSLQINNDTIVCQARRTTNLGIGVSFTSIQLDTTDVENDSSIIDHNPSVNSDRITFGETGYYSIEYNLVMAPLSNAVNTGISRLVLNGSTEVDGSSLTVSGDWSAGNRYDHTMNKKIVSLFNAGDFITAELQASQSGTLIGASIVAIRLRGTRGANGINGVDGAPGDIIWTSDWDSGTTYTANEAVTNNGTSYVCILGHTNQEPPNGTFWDIIASKGDVGPSGDINWQGSWNSGTSYIANDTVESAGSSYICIIANTNQQPPNANWELVASKGDVGDTGPSGPAGDITWTGDWSAIITYIPNNAVSYDGASYVCILGNTNQVPPNATFWDVLSDKGDTGATGATGPAGTVSNIFISTGDDVTSSSTSSTAAFGAMTDVIGSMTVTPTAGTYVVQFSASTSMGNRANFGQVEIYVDGVGLGHSRRTVQIRANGQKTPVHTQTVVTTTGAESIEIRFSITGNTFNIWGRSLLLIKMS